MPAFVAGSAACPCKQSMARKQETWKRRIRSGQAGGSGRCRLQTGKDSHRSGDPMRQCKKGRCTVLERSDLGPAFALQSEPSCLVGPTILFRRRWHNQGASTHKGEPFAGLELLAARSNDSLPWLPEKVCARGASSSNGSRHCG